MKTLILGIGNILLSDEGVGVHIAQRLQQYWLPPSVEVIDGGTGGFELLHQFKGKDRVIILDALHAEAQPGAVFRIPAEKLELNTSTFYSAHQSGLSELIQNTRRLFPKLQITFFGIVPKDISTPAIGLSPEVESNIPKIIPLILNEIE